MYVHTANSPHYELLHVWTHLVCEVYVPSSGNVGVEPELVVYIQCQFSPKSKSKA